MSKKAAERKLGIPISLKAESLARGKALQSFFFHSNTRRHGVCFT
jgi:hypothetical protein